MAFFMQKKFKEIGHFSRVHGYKGKIVISFNSEDPSILKKIVPYGLKNLEYHPLIKLRKFKA